MKLTPNEKDKIRAHAVNLAYLDGLITNQEMVFYLTIMLHAFYNIKYKKRGLSMLQVHQMEDWGYAKKRVQTLLGSLKRKGFVKAHYHVKTSDGLYITDDLSEFDGENGLGRKRIWYTKYEVLPVPKIEKRLIKEAKLKKKAKHSYNPS